MDVKFVDVKKVILLIVVVTIYAWIQGAPNSTFITLTNDIELTLSHSKIINGNAVIDLSVWRCSSGAVKVCFKKLSAYSVEVRFLW